ncbi:hypothetical protein D9619_006228 [Psilocybe cf. subviscida]|uniref:Uncharacterized protein n=1 Tax=Psilocybe cf. subviscida TaxID=2480587 RepID=A0A8H5B6L2_9AGAR|nr:hypothetical protein D9619_006228 [Psilocybe cf. subviscida]
MPTPDLPLELLGHIVDFHREREKGTSFSSRGVGEFVKELVITILPHEQPGGRKRDHNPTIHEGALLAVLKDIGEKVKLKQLDVRGQNVWNPPQWDTTPLGVRVALESLMHLPTVSSLLFKFVVSNISPGPSHFQVRHFHALHMDRLECITSWDIINQTCETLEELNIFDEAIFDTELLFSTQRTLDGFPQLQTYVYSYSSCQSEREILHTFSNAVGFLKSTRQHLHLRAIKLHLEFDARSDIWEAEIDSLAKHSTWKVLDKALASENLPVLKSVDVKIKLKVLGAQNDFEFTRTLANRKDELLRDAREASQKRVRLMMMETLSATQRLRIPLKLDVSVEV